MGLLDRIQHRLQHGWNAFMNKDPTAQYQNVGVSYSHRPDRTRLSRGNERSILTSITNRIALDCSAMSIKHVRVDENERYHSTINSGLNECLTVEANIDQTGRALRDDIFMSMLDEGCIAVLPVDTTIDPTVTASFEIHSMRVCKIVQWYPAHVRIRAYNEINGQFEEILQPKRTVAIIENPFYAVMNEPNSTMQRLIRKLNLLDVIDDQSGSGKLDLIIQLPYVIKSDARRQQADKRRKDIEDQLKGPYGIAYTDGTERITQLNRPVENNLMKQVEYLTSMLFSQLGMTTGILDGTADENTMNNYLNRIVEPIMSAAVDEMKRKFLTKTARTQGQTIMFFRDPFKLVPVTAVPDMADKLTRNEVMSSNEVRQVMGMKPSSDPRADELRNKNINAPANEQTPSSPVTVEETPNNQNGVMTEVEYLQSVDVLDELDSEIDALEAELDGRELKHYASPYYDPAKAHEYYERTKQLKSRTSVAGLNDEGKAAAKYVREQLTNERKSRITGHKEQTKSQIDSKKAITKAQIESHKHLMQTKIDSLRARLKNMSKTQKAERKEEIYAEIASLREENKAIRESLNAQFRADRTALNQEHKDVKTALNNEYDEKYAQELEKIKNTSEFQKTNSGSSRGIIYKK